jgi:hypothetical protein
MVNRSKNIGTMAETAIVNAARLRGFPNADRRVLAGRYDKGDVLLCPGAIIEVKGGQAAKDASPGLITAWLAETEAERAHAGADIAFLAVQRRGIGLPNADQWDAWIPNPASLCNDPTDRAMFEFPIRVTVAQALWMLRRAGWGDPHE